MKYAQQFILLLVTGLTSPLALAHDGHVATGLLAGLGHPLTGADHLIALILLGIFISRLKSKKVLAFAGVMSALYLGVIGALFLGAGAWVEAAILLSLPVFFTLLWIKQGAQKKLAIVIMSGFMVAHGWAHGLEMSALNSSFEMFGFIAGFMLTSIMIMALYSLPVTWLKTQSVKKTLVNKSVVNKPEVNKPLVNKPSVNKYCA